MEKQDSPPPTITTMKILIIKNGEYDIWRMRMRQYICHTDHLWDIIVDGDLQEKAAPAREQSSPPTPKTVKLLTAKRNQGKRSYGDNGRRNTTTNEPSSQALVAQDGLGGYEWSNDFDEPINYALMTISSSSSSSSFDNEVQNCSKQCLESFKTLQKNYDCEREKHSRARLEIQGYELALESLESRIIRHEKNELAWGEKYDQMSAKDKNGLGYGTQLDEISNKSETDSEISMSVFEVRSSDEEITPANDRFSKADGYHAVPPLIIRNFLTLRDDISFTGLDEYAIRKKIIESKITEPKDDTSESKTSETVGKTNEVEKSKPKINRDKVIIEDWNSDDEDDVSEVNTVNPVKTNETQTVKTQVDKIGQISQKEGIGFKKIKACFVCKSTDHLIKDCDFYAKKSPEPKLKTMVNTGQRVVKPVWDNAKRVNHQKISNKLKYPQARRTFVPSGVLTRTGLVNPVRPNGKRAVHTVSTARPISTARPVSTARPFAPKIAQTGSAIRPIYPRMDNVRPRASYSPIKRSYYTKPAFRPKNLKQDVKTSGVKNMTTAGTRAVVNTGKGKMDNALKKSRSTSVITTPAPTTTTTTTSVTNAQLQAMIDQGVSAALAARDANRNGDDSHTSGTSTERVVELIQWFERMETVFRISNCPVENQVKFSTCTLLAGALTWWNSHVMTVSHDGAYTMTWADLRKKMTDKYCPRNEMKKLKAELWNLKVKGTDVIGYNQRFQELALSVVLEVSRRSLTRLKGSLKTLPETIKTQQKTIEAKYWQGPLFARDWSTVERKPIWGSKPLCAKITTMVHVLQNAINATKLAILLMTVGVWEMPTMLTIRGALGQARNLLATSVEFKDTTGGNAQS
ncbi:reverse transcriptase domain-containing protein [Tanacetum coccineum]|uniref:Reverse transcriptase domain-containing protein n=1 Tax=Tanacetum coccineum TaxID=301880 RepID=A0ABQ5GMK9_9ASTR